MRTAPVRGSPKLACRGFRKFDTKVLSVTPFVTFESRVPASVGAMKKANERSRSDMKRIILMATVALVMAAMVVANATPALS